MFLVFIDSHEPLSNVQEGCRLTAPAFGTLPIGRYGEPVFAMRLALLTKCATQRPSRSIGISFSFSASSAMRATSTRPAGVARARDPRD
jgi:hypothetical protein